MNRTLVASASLALLLAPLAAADLLPLPPLPSPLDSIPSDAMAVGLGGGPMRMPGCDDTYSMALELADETESIGAWTAGTAFVLESVSDGQTPLGNDACGSNVHSPGLGLRGEDFDPAVGGCFGGAPRVDTLCLSFVSQDPVTGIVTYHAENEETWTGEPSDFFSGDIQVVFANLPDA